jgi:hypothetical protein
MDLRLPGFELREPLSRYPVRGALVGLVVGLVFGVLTADRAASGDVVIVRYALGAAVGGLIIGTFLPAFRKRLWASTIVAISATVTLGVAWGVDSALPLEAVGFAGLAFGILYGVLLWDYE